MRCTFCTLASGCRPLDRREGGLPATVVHAQPWSACTASIVCLGWRWLRCALLELAPGNRLDGADVCCVPSDTCFEAGCGETAVRVTCQSVSRQHYQLYFFLCTASLISRGVILRPWR